MSEIRRYVGLPDQQQDVCQLDFVAIAARREAIAACGV